MPEGVSAAEVGKEISEHHEPAENGEQTAPHHARTELISIIEAVILSVVALLAAWSGYSAAKWGTHSSLALAKASTSRGKANLADIEANQIRTLDSVSFNAVETAYASGEAKLFRIAVRRLRPGYRPAFRAWLATHPLTNPKAPPGPAYMPQYRVPEAVHATALNARADALFSQGEAAAGTEDKYVRLTVLLAAVLSAHCDLVAGKTAFPGLASVQQLLHEPELRAIFTDAVVGPRLRMTESILRAGADNGEVDAATLTPYTARVGTALVNQQLLLTGAPPNKRQLAQIVDTVLPHLS